MLADEDSWSVSPLEPTDLIPVECGRARRARSASRSCDSLFLLAASRLPGGGSVRRTGWEGRGLSAWPDRRGAWMTRRKCVCLCLCLCEGERARARARARKDEGVRCVVVGFAQLRSGAVWIDQRPAHEVRRTTTQPASSANGRWCRSPVRAVFPPFRRSSLFASNAAAGAAADRSCLGSLPPRSRQGQRAR